MNIHIAATTLASLALLSNTQAHPSIRGLLRQGKNNAYSPGYLRTDEMLFWASNNGEQLLQEVEGMCDSFGCDGVDTDALTCDVWVTNSILAIDHPTCSEDMTEEEKQAFYEEMEDFRQQMFDALMSMSDEERLAFRAEQETVDAANKATVLGCGCCIGMDSIADLVDGKEGAVAKVLDLRSNGVQGRQRGSGSFGDGTGIGLNNGDCGEDCDGSGPKRENNTGNDRVNTKAKNAGK